MFPFFGDDTMDWFANIPENLIVCITKKMETLRYLEVLADHPITTQCHH
jgi:hypothetical protein